MKGATLPLRIGRVTHIVSIHAPVKGATRRSAFLAPRPRVSIHAPVKGATHGLRPRARQDYVSIHAPVKGATQKAPPFDGAFPSFNPRAREGRDANLTAQLAALDKFQSTRP